MSVSLAQKALFISCCSCSLSLRIPFSLSYLHFSIDNSKNQRYGMKFGDFLHHRHTILLPPPFSCFFLSFAPFLKVLKKEKWRLLCDKASKISQEVMVGFIFSTSNISAHEVLYTELRNIMICYLTFDS